MSRIWATLCYNLCLMHQSSQMLLPQTTHVVCVDHCASLSVLQLLLYLRIAQPCMVCCVLEVVSATEQLASLSGPDLE